MICTASVRPLEVFHLVHQLGGKMPRRDGHDAEVAFALRLGERRRE